MTLDSPSLRPASFDVNPLYDLTQAVAAAKLPSEIFDAALTALRDSIGVERAAVLLFDDHGVMRFRAWRGLSPEYRAAVDGHSPCTRDTTDAAPVLVGDIREDPELAALRPTIDGEGICALAFVPLAIGPRLLGKFMLYYDAPHEFDEQEILVARTIAAHVAFAIDQHEHREHQHRYRELIDALGLAVYTTDATGKITFFNDEAVNLWGRAPRLGEDMWCGSWRLYSIDGDPIRHDECPMAIAIREHRPVRGVEIIAERPDGQRVTLLPHPTPLHDASGALTGAVNILVDITERREMEQRLRSANSVKDEFLGLVSHEIKTPITTIVGNAEILNRTSPDLIREEQRSEALRDILDEGRRLHGIIDNLLVIARLDRGAEIEMEIVIAERVAAAAIEELRRKSPSREVTLHASSTPLLVEVNQGYLEQVLRNLLSDADKYSPHQAAIELVLERADGFMLARVFDRGEGIGDDERERIFMPFYRSSANSKSVGGVGVGLSVCQRLVEALGGTIWCRPREGRRLRVRLFAPPLRGCRLRTQPQRPLARPFFTARS